MGPEIKDTIANGTSIAALGGVLIDWQAPLTVLLVLTGVILTWPEFGIGISQVKNR